MMDFCSIIFSQTLIYEVSIYFIERCNSILFPIRDVPGSILGLMVPIQVKREIATIKQGTIGSVPVLCSHHPPAHPATRDPRKAQLDKLNKETPDRTMRAHVRTAVPDISPLTVDVSAFSVWEQAKQ
jgi:hypothetical protein